MNKLDVSAFVTIASGKFVRVKVINDIVKNDIESLGFIFDINLSEYVIPVSGHKSKAKIFFELEKLGVCFSAGKEWSPAELFEYYRELGLLSGKYKRISWRSLSESDITLE